MRTFVMGDIHGAFKAFMQCLALVNFDYKKDKLITLGDIADGWPEVPQIVNELLKIKNRVDIRGNHDSWLEEWLKYGYAFALHYTQGGKASIDAYIKLRTESELEEELHCEFFSHQHNYYIDEQNRLFVHGGYTSELGVGYENRQSDYYWDRSLWGKAMSTREPMQLKLTKMYKEVFIGHTSTEQWGQITPMHRSNVWNLDTGAGYRGKLTIMDVDTKEYWQSDLVKDLYPGIIGK